MSLVNKLNNKNTYLLRLLKVTTNNMVASKRVVDTFISTSCPSQYRQSLVSQTISDELNGAVTSIDQSRT